MDPVRGQQHVDVRIGHIPDVSDAARAAAEAVTRRWCEGCGLDEQATLEMLDKLDLGG